MTKGIEDGKAREMDRELVRMCLAGFQGRGERRDTWAVDIAGAAGRDGIGGRQDAIVMIDGFSLVLGRRRAEWASLPIPLAQVVAGSLVVAGVMGAYHLVD